MTALALANQFVEAQMRLINYFNWFTTHPCNFYVLSSSIFDSGI